MAVVEARPRHLDTGIETRADGEGEMQVKIVIVFTSSTSSPTDGENKLERFSNATFFWLAYQNLSSVACAINVLR